MADFSTVTELAGDSVTLEQVSRAVNRYTWIASFCKGKDVVDVACGTGPGLGLVARVARSLVAGDISPGLLAQARAHYGDRVAFVEMDAQALPFPDASKEAIAIVEALYYIPDANKFFAECRRVLVPGGKLLIVTTNKDIFDFHPSPFSTVYHGVVELAEALRHHGFDCSFWGDTPVSATSLKQRLLRPIKWAVVHLGLMPNTMAGKKLMKRLVFGALVPMPAELQPGSHEYRAPAPIRADSPDSAHKILMCAATRRD